MDNTVCLFIYLAFLLADLVLLFDVRLRYSSVSMVRYYSLYLVAGIGWTISHMLTYILRDDALVRYFFDFKLLFVAMIPILLFLTVAGFYKLIRFFPKWLMPLIFFIPLVTAVLAVLSPLHKLLMVDFHVVSFSPVLDIEYERGVWFMIHTVYSQIAALAVGVLMVSFYRRCPRAYRHGSIYMFSAVLAYFFFTAAFFFGPQLDGLDFNLIGVSLSGILFYFGTVANGKLDYLHIERRDVFLSFDEAVFILDEQGLIIDLNTPAARFFALLGVSQLERMDFEGALSTLSGEGKLVRRRLEGEMGDDIYVLSSKYPAVYHMNNKPIAPQNGLPAGKYVILADVTKNRLVIDRLRETAGIDSLTGLLNRYGYNALLRTLDEPENLPLSIVIGDVNGLKGVNDTYGHYEGDMQLRSISEVLSSCVPQGGHVARIGGDEFAMLLPNIGAEQAKKIVMQVRDKLPLINPGGPAPSVAFGCATKTEKGQNISSLINEADRKMYSNKQESTGA